MSSTSNYQRIPTGSPPRSRPTSPSSAAELPRPASPTEEDRPLRAAVQEEFNRAPPAWWKRVALLIALVFMGWLAVRLGGMAKQPDIVYASRYNEEFKYRPAASPVITEYLKDGRMRLRGATPGGIGVREEDIPKTPERKKADEQKRVVEAREAAKEKLGLKRKKGSRRLKPKSGLK